MPQTPFLGEIDINSFNFAQQGWAMCNGQFLPINQNQALFSLLGTMYGGNGQTTFALPDLRGRVPIHVGNGHTQGEAAGSAAVTLNLQQLPQHLHSLQANTTAPAATNANSIPGNTKVLAPGNASLQGGQTAPVNMYGPPNALTPMAPATVSNVGGSQAHNNMAPYLVLNFVIALQGIFPSRN
jgi:microcystin-dependent protein